MNKRIARHKVVYETIRSNIEENIYQEGSLLPSENEMCSLFNVTRPTIRQALNHIENDGYIKRYQGKGSVVQKIHHRLGILSLKGVTEVLGTQGSLSTRILKKPTVEPWPDCFKYDLTEKEKSHGCISMDRLRLVDNSPTLIEIIYIVNIELPRFCQKKYEKRSLFSTLKKDYNIEVREGEQNIRAVGADKHTSKLLQITEGQPILHLEGILRTSNSDLRIFVDTFCSTEKYYLFGSF
ncbi:MAG: GntR family transcriptional regulator [Melioribacteraceae bacterium]|nr:GntR family transcriptional regulator [Melioribacteraceae bacterium]